MEGQNNQNNAKPVEMTATTSKVRMSKTNIAKHTGSEASLTPSQTAEKNARKNPLDALSRSVKFGTVERRSGLQEVDEGYLQRNIFSRVRTPRSSGLESMPTAGSRTQVQENQGPVQRGEPFAYTPTQADIQAAAGAYQQHHPQQHYQQAVAQQQPPQQASQQYYQQQVPVVSQQQQQPQQQQMQQQQPPTVIASAQSLMPGQGQQQQHQAQPQRLAAGGYTDAASAGSGEPDMCTTCPNCQTTLYLIIHSGAVPAKRDAQTGRTHHDTVDLIGQNFAEMAEKMQQVHVSDQYQGNHKNQQEPDIVSMINDESNLENEPPQEEFAEAEIHDELGANKRAEEDENNLNYYPRTIDNDNIGCVRKPTTFTLSKQHTGMKNRSFGVGMAVTPTQNMEFHQGGREDFNIIKVHRPIGSKLNSPHEGQGDINDAMSTTSSGGEGLTEQGYHDLKFFHNRLW